MRGSNFIFVCAQLLYYKCHKINFKLGRLYIGSPDWIKRKKATINDINKKDNKCFQYAIAVALNYKGNRKKSWKNNNKQTFHK